MKLNNEKKGEDMNPLEIGKIRCRVDPVINASVVKAILFDRAGPKKSDGWIIDISASMGDGSR